METIATRVNDCLAGARGLRPAEELFDAFWREGELALLTGPSGAGKSFLAFQIAESLARGQGIDTFQMPALRRKVLYVDLAMSTTQFQRRYAMYDEGKPDRPPRIFQFSRNFYRAAPADITDFDKWLAREIEMHDFEVVIIDDLSAFTTTLNGSREIVRTMRELKRLKDRTGVSMLVLSCVRAGNERGSRAGEDTLGRQPFSQIADSVFAIGVRATVAAERYLYQMHSRNSVVRWNKSNGPLCQIHRFDTGFIGMRFDALTVPQLSEAVRAIVCDIKRMRDNGMSFRQIGRTMRMCHVKCSRLVRKWRPEMEPVDPQPAVNAEPLAGETAIVDNNALISTPDDDGQEWDECGFEKPEWIAFERGPDQPGSGDSEPGVDGSRVFADDRGTVRGTGRNLGMNVSQIPFAAALRRMTIYDLEMELDEYEKEIYVEKRNEKTNQPLVWYSFDRSGNLNRWERRFTTIFGSKLGRTIHLPAQRACLKSPSWKAPG